MPWPAQSSCSPAEGPWGWVHGERTKLPPTGTCLIGVAHCWFSSCAGTGWINAGQNLEHLMVGRRRTPGTLKAHFSFLLGELPSSLPIIACTLEISAVLPSCPHVPHTHTAFLVPSHTERCECAWWDVSTHPAGSALHYACITGTRLSSAWLAEGTEMCGKSMHQAYSSPPITASQRPACHRHLNTLTAN